MRFEIGDPQRLFKQSEVWDPKGDTGRDLFPSDSGDELHSCTPSSRPSELRPLETFSFGGVKVFIALAAKSANCSQGVV